MNNPQKNFLKEFQQQTQKGKRWFIYLLILLFVSLLTPILALVFDIDIKKPIYAFVLIALICIWIPVVIKVAMLSKCPNCKKFMGRDMGKFCPNCGVRIRED